MNQDPTAASRAAGYEKPDAIAIGSIRTDSTGNQNLADGPKLEATTTTSSLPVVLAAGAATPSLERDEKVSIRTTSR